MKYAQCRFNLDNAFAMAQADQEKVRVSFQIENSETRHTAFMSPGDAVRFAKQLLAASKTAANRTIKAIDRVE